MGNTTQVYEDAPGFEEGRMRLIDVITNAPNKKTVLLLIRFDIYNTIGGGVRESRMDAQTHIYGPAVPPQEAVEEMLTVLIKYPWKTA